MENPLREIRLLLGMRQQEFGEELGFSEASAQRVVSRLERAARLKETYRAKVRSNLDGLIQAVGERLGGTPGRKHLRDQINAVLANQAEVIDTPLSAGFLAATARPHPTAPLEGPTEAEARLFKVAFRTHYLIDRLRLAARARGLTTRRIQGLGHGLCVLKGRGETTDEHRGVAAASALVPIPSSQDVALEPGCLICVGSPYKHPVSRKLLARIARLQRVSVEFHFHEGRAFYFGYPTRFVDLRVADKKWLRPRRYCVGDCVEYVDYGVIAHAPKDKEIVATGVPGFRGIRQIVLVAGTHRLGTGVGVALLLDQTLRHRILGDDNPLVGLGLHVFKVTYRARGAQIRTLRAERVQL